MEEGGGREEGRGRRKEDDVRARIAPHDSRARARTALKPASHKGSPIWVALLV